VLVHHRLLVFGLGNTVGIVSLLTVSERMKVCIKLVDVPEGYRTGTNKRSLLYAESVTVWGPLPLVARARFSNSRISRCWRSGAVAGFRTSRDAIDGFGLEVPERR
jgi:hypothetical protein